MSLKDDAVIVAVVLVFLAAKWPLFGGSEVPTPPRSRRRIPRAITPGSSRERAQQRMQQQLDAFKKKALDSKDPATIRAAATQLRGDGYRKDADELDAAAEALERKP